MALHVYKFGGTSVGSTEAIDAIVRIVRDARRDHQVALVVSAMSGVTDALLGGARAAAAGEISTVQTITHEIRSRHTAVGQELIPDPAEQAELQQELNRLLVTFATSCQAVNALGELTPRASDTIAAVGERLCAPLVAAALRSHGLTSQAVDAACLIVTDDRFGDASPLLELTRTRVQAHLHPLLEQGVIPVITGFVGATRTGLTTTLGRGGSDYSASIISSMLNANTVVFYKAVDGVMTADPQLVPEAQVLHRMSVEEVSELAYFGAKVLHPKAIEPLIERNISVHVKSTFNPHGTGTLVVPGHELAPGTIRAVTALRDMTKLIVVGRAAPGMPAIAPRIFAALAHYAPHVLICAQGPSSQRVSMVVPSQVAATVRQTLEAAVAGEMARGNIADIIVQNAVAVISVVGGGLGTAARVFEALSVHGITINEIAPGASRCSVNLVVDDHNAAAAVRAIHPLTAAAATPGQGLLVPQPADAPAAILIS